LFTVKSVEGAVHLSDIGLHGQCVRLKQLGLPSAGPLWWPVNGYQLGAYASGRSLLGLRCHCILPKRVGHYKIAQAMRAPRSQWAIALQQYTGSLCSRHRSQLRQVSAQDGHSIDDAHRGE
jgi:hypothetical protein